MRNQDRGGYIIRAAFIATLPIQLLCLACVATAGTVAPPSDLGALARQSEAVVYARAEHVDTELVNGTPWTHTRFHRSRQLGGTPVGPSFTLSEPGGSAAGVGLSMGGVPEFAEGTDYLLFLGRDAAGRWRTRMLAYGILEAFPDGYLAPIKAAHELALVETESFEPPGVYRADALLDHLEAVLAGAAWDAEKAGRIDAGPAPATHEAPGDCDYFTDDSPGGTGLPLRWFGFESGGAAVIWHSTPGQAGISDGGQSAVTDGIDAWAGDGSAAVRYDFGGSRASTHDCGDGSAIESGDTNVIYNDPCDEIGALNSCSGTLAQGGIFYSSSSTGTYGGEDWHDVSSPFVLVNDGTECVGETAFKEMLTHELGHTLAFGHHTDNDATMSETLNNDGRGASITSTDRNCAVYSYGFFDVPYANAFWDFIESVKFAGVTAGCGNGNYCPGDAVRREQMAVFLLKAVEGSGYSPPACSGTFNDVPCPSLFADWIEELADRNITAGCGGGNYCPDDSVTREQMAVFLLKALEGSSYSPPSCSGTFGDVPCPSLFADWIEELAARNITAGCGGGDYCPGDPNTRGQMAVFLTKTFSLP